LFRLAVFILALAGDLSAERNSSIATKVAVYGGLSKFLSLKSSDRPDLNWKESILYGSFYPSVQMKSQGAHSAVGLNYTFGLNRMKTGRDFDWKSQSASVSFSSYRKRWKINLTESFDFTDFMFNSLQPAFTRFDEFRFLYTPLAERSS